MKHYNSSFYWTAWFLSGPNCIVPKFVIGHTRLWVDLKTGCPSIHPLISNAAYIWALRARSLLEKGTLVFSWGDKIFMECASCTVGCDIEKSSAGNENSVIIYSWCNSKPVLWKTKYNFWIIFILEQTVLSNYLFIYLNVSFHGTNNSIQVWIDMDWVNCPFNSGVTALCPAELRSNLPQHTCLEVSSIPSKTLISWFRCVLLGLEINSAGHRPSRNKFGDPCFNW